MVPMNFISGELKRYDEIFLAQRGDGPEKRTTDIKDAGHGRNGNH